MWWVSLSLSFPLCWSEGVVRCMTSLASSLLSSHFFHSLIPISCFVNWVFMELSPSLLSHSSSLVSFLSISFHSLPMTLSSLSSLVRVSHCVSEWWFLWSVQSSSQSCSFHCVLFLNFLVVLSKQSCSSEISRVDGQWFSLCLFLSVFLCMSLILDSCYSLVQYLLSWPLTRCWCIFAIVQSNPLSDTRFGLLWFLLPISLSVQWMVLGSFLNNFWSFLSLSSLSITLLRDSIRLVQLIYRYWCV